MKGSYLSAPDLESAVFGLLDIVFPGISAHAARIAAMGAQAEAAGVDPYAEAPGMLSRPGSVAASVRWDHVSTPFTAIHDGKVVAHVGVIEVPAVVMGTPTTVATIHAVATHPEHRRKGLYRGVMDEALRHCSGRFETQILTTEHPEYFQPFGFRHVQEHRFRHVRTPFSRQEDRSQGTGTAFRLLDMSDGSDLAILFALLENRAPVSQIVGVVRENAIFCFNEGWRPLYYEPGLGAIICMESEGNTLRLYDIVAWTIPRLDTILEQLPHSVNEVVIHFSPDCLDTVYEPEPYLLDHDGPSYLMVRGPFPADTERFTLPRPART